MTDKKAEIWIFLIGLLFFCSCSPVRHLQEGQALYVGGKVKLESKPDKISSLKDDMEALLRPRPNKKILGMYPGLFFYNISKKPKGKGLNYLLHEKWGEPPVLASELNLQTNENILKNFLENKGFFRATVEGKAEEKKKKTKAIYTVVPGKRYTISQVSFRKDSGLIGREVFGLRTSALLDSGRYYDLETIKAERERIRDSVKNKGYFYFTPDYLLVQVDSNLNGKADLRVRVKKDIPGIAAQKYRIGKVNVFANYSLNEDSLMRNSKGENYKGLNIIDPNRTFRPSIFSRAIYIEPDSLYTLSNHELTLSRLVNLNVFKFVKIEYEPADSGKNKPVLNTNIFLTPSKKKSISLELSGNSRSNNFVGSSAQFTWQNRNIFKGAELLKLNMGGSFETQVGGDQAGSNIYTYSPGITVEVPRFVTPFEVINVSRVKIPKTIFDFNYESSHREHYYDLNTFNLTVGYRWKENSRITNTLNLFDVRYVLPSNLTPTFQDIITKFPILEHSFKRQFILGTSYRFEYSDLGNKRKNNFYFNGYADVSGNLFGLLKGKHNFQNPATLFGNPFSQYVKLSGDARNTLHLNNKGSDWVNRIYLGYGYSYGNSRSLPYIKQFYNGGSNSLRGFRTRTLGPGSYHTEETGFQANEAGDIRFEANSELRFPISGFLKGAVFADAGNIWLLRSDSTRPGAKFEWKNAASELAVDAGVGLRFDISFFVLRFDLAFPLRKPWLPKQERWVIDQIDFGSKAWRRENMVLNIAIGYPF